MSIEAMAAWATILTAAGAGLGWSIHRLAILMSRWRERKHISKSRRVVAARQAALAAQASETSESGIILWRSIDAKDLPKDHDAWNTLIRRRLLCPEKVISSTSPQTGWLKRVRTSDQPPVLLEVVRDDGALALWPAYEVQALDEVSSNAEILDAYRHYYRVAPA